MRKPSQSRSSSGCDATAGKDGAQMHCLNQDFLCDLQISDCAQHPGSII